MLGVIAAAASEIPPVALILAVIAAVIAFLGLLFGIIAVAASKPSRGPLVPTGPDRDFNTPGGRSLPRPPGVDSSVIDGSITPRVFVFSRFPNLDLDAVPGWWDYPGRWGIMVNSRVLGWDNGSRRTDRYHRSAAYWNTLSLFELWQTDRVKFETLDRLCMG